MFSSIRMTHSSLPLTFHRRRDEWYKDAGGDETYRHCLLHAACWLRGSSREVPDGNLTKLRGDWLYERHVDRAGCRTCSAAMSEDLLQ